MSIYTSSALVDEIESWLRDLCVNGQHTDEVLRQLRARLDGTIQVENNEAKLLQELREAQKKLSAMESYRVRATKAEQELSELRERIEA